MYKQAHPEPRLIIEITHALQIRVTCTQIMYIVHVIYIVTCMRKS